MKRTSRTAERVLHGIQKQGLAPKKRAIGRTPCLSEHVHNLNSQVYFMNMATKGQ